MAMTVNGNNRQDAIGHQDDLSPLELEVLDEYTRLAENLAHLSTAWSDLASQPSATTLDALRGLERKTATVFTLLKASVYSIILQQEIFGEEQQQQQQQQQRQ